MGMIAATCSACGAPLQTDGLRAIRCPYCGARYLPEGGGSVPREEGPEALYEKFSVQEKLGRTENARSIAKEMTERYPEEPLAWDCHARAAMMEAGEALTQIGERFSGEKLLTGNGKRVYFPLDSAGLRARYSGLQNLPNGLDGATQRCVDDIAHAFHVAEHGLERAGEGIANATRVNEDGASYPAERRRETEEKLHALRDRVASLTALLDSSAVKANREARKFTAVSIVGVAVMAFLAIVVFTLL